MKLNHLVDKTIEQNWETLMIRACKNGKRSPRRLRRIYAASRALPIEYTPIEYATNGMMEIIVKFDLIRNLHDFIVEIDHERSGFWYAGCRDRKKYEMDFKEAFFRRCASTIALTEVSKFPGYRAPAYFRNKYGSPL